MLKSYKLSDHLGIQNIEAKQMMKYIQMIDVPHSIEAIQAMEAIQVKQAT